MTIFSRERQLSAPLINYYSSIYHYQKRVAHIHRGSILTDQFSHCSKISRHPLSRVKLFPIISRGRSNLY